MLNRFLLASVTLLSLALAQSSTRIAFTSVPATVEAGETYNITWGGGNGSPVTLTLRKGDPNDLETVGILADRVSETYYEWKVAEDLESADDYALQITQGQSDINYSGLFSLEGGSGSSNSTTGSSTTTRNSTSTTSSEGSRTTNGTATSNSTESTTTTESSTTETESSTATRTSRTASSSAASTAANTPAPSSNSGALQLGSSAAFAVAVLGAVVFLN